MEDARNNIAINYVFTAVLTRDDGNNPVIMDNSYVFEVTEDSTNICIPIDSIDVSGTVDSLMARFIPDGYETEHDLKLQISPPVEEVEQPVALVPQEQPVGQGNLLPLDGESVGKPDEAYWSENASKLLISLYPLYRKKVADRLIRSQEKMWQPLANELNSHKYCFTAEQCKNKWKTLERGYKKKLDNNKLSGRARKNCSYETQLTEVFKKRSNVFPEIVLGTGTPRTKEMLLKQCLGERTSNEVEKEPTTQSPSTSKVGGSGKPMRVRARSVASELKAFRMESAQRQKEKEANLKAREEKKIALLERKNLLIKRTNDLLEVLIRAQGLQVPVDEGNTPLE